MEWPSFSHHSSALVIPGRRSAPRGLLTDHLSPDISPTNFAPASYRRHIGFSHAFARTQVMVKATTSVVQADLSSAFDTHSRNAPIPLLQMHL
jgi:hypothetical protein